MSGLCCRENGNPEKQVLAVEGTDKAIPPQILSFTSLGIKTEEAREYLAAYGGVPGRLLTRSNDKKSYCKITLAVSE